MISCLYLFRRVSTTNVTLEDNVTVVEVNETVVDVDTTWLRQDDQYIRFVWLKDFMLMPK